MSDVVRDENFIQVKKMDKRGMDLPIFPDDNNWESQIKQKQDGSCYLLSSLYSIAMNKPEMLKEIIRDNGNGTVTVTFYQTENFVRKPLEVTVEKTLPPVDSDSAPWVRLIEKAFVASKLKIQAGKPPEFISYDEGSKFDMDNLAYYNVHDFQSMIDPLPGIKVSKDEEIVSQPDYYSAEKAFENILSDAVDKKAFIVISTKNHAMVFLDIKKENNKSFISYYDQYKGKKYKVPVKKIFSSGTDIDSIDIAYPDENNKNNIQISLSPAKLVKELNKSFQTVSADSFKDITGNCFLSMLEKSVKEYAPDEYKNGAMEAYRNIFTAGLNVNKFLKKKFAELNGKFTNRELNELFAKPSGYRNEIIRDFYNNLLLDVDEYKKSGKANDRNLNLGENSNIMESLQAAAKDSIKAIVIECFNSFLNRAVSEPADFPTDPSADFPADSSAESSVDSSVVRSISDEVFSLGKEVNACVNEFTEKLFKKYGDKFTNGELKEFLAKPSKDRSNMIDALSRHFFQNLENFDNDPDMNDYFKKKFPISEEDISVNGKQYPSEMLVEHEGSYSAKMWSLANEGMEEAEKDSLQKSGNINDIKMSYFKKEFLRLAGELKKTDVFYSKGSKPYQNICSAIAGFKKEFEGIDDYTEFEGRFDEIVRTINTNIGQYRDLHKEMKLDDRMLTRLKIFNRMEMLGSRLHEIAYNPGFAEKYAEKYIHAKLIDTIKNGKPDEAKRAAEILMDRSAIDNRAEGIAGVIKGFIPASELDSMLMLKIGGEKFMKALDKKLGKAAPSVLDSYEPEDVTVRIENNNCDEILLS